MYTPESARAAVAAEVEALKARYAAVAAASAVGGGTVSIPMAPYHMYVDPPDAPQPTTLEELLIDGRLSLPGIDFVREAGLAYQADVEARGTRALPDGAAWIKGLERRGFFGSRKVQAVALCASSDLERLIDAAPGTSPQFREHGDFFAWKGPNGETANTNADLLRVRRHFAFRVFLLLSGTLPNQEAWRQLKVFIARAGPSRWLHRMVTLLDASTEEMAERLARFEGVWFCEDAREIEMKFVMTLHKLGALLSQDERLAVREILRKAPAVDDKLCVQYLIKQSGRLRLTPQDVLFLVVTNSPQFEFSAQWRGSTDSSSLPPLSGYSLYSVPDGNAST